MLFYALTISLSAFLLFEVQPVIAKMILPWFGGSSAVWSTCMLFFQVVLLLGYVYAHWLNKLAPRKQAIAHISLLAVSLLVLPIIPSPGWKHSGMAQPSLTILALLAVTVGLPYFLLSSTSPLLQAWYARTHKQGLPYRFFALSNFFSMLALLSYPFLIEPNLPSRMQGSRLVRRIRRLRPALRPHRVAHLRGKPGPRRRSSHANQLAPRRPPGPRACSGWASPPRPPSFCWPSPPISPRTSPPSLSSGSCPSPSICSASSSASNRRASTTAPSSCPC